MFVYPHDPQFLPFPPGFSHIANAEWVFLRFAIIPSAECRQRNYSVGTPSTPIPHSLRTLSLWEIKQNHLDRSGTNTSKPFVCHTWGPQMDSHHTVDWKCMLIYTSIPLFPNITAILPALKCICLCCLHSTNLPSSAFDDTTDTMWCSLITCQRRPALAFWNSTRAICIFHPHPTPSSYCWSNE